MAVQGRIPYKEYKHDPNIKDENNHTVAYYLKQNHLPISNEWYDDDMKDEKRNPDFIE